MRLRHQAAEVEAQAHAAGAAGAGGVGAEEGLGQMGQLVVGHARAVVAHLEFNALPRGERVRRFGAERELYGVDNLTII